MKDLVMVVFCWLALLSHVCFGWETYQTGSLHNQPVEQKFEHCQFLVDSQMLDMETGLMIEDWKPIIGSLAKDSKLLLNMESHWWDTNPGARGQVVRAMNLFRPDIQPICYGVIHGSFGFDNPTTLARYQQANDLRADSLDERKYKRHLCGECYLVGWNPTGWTREQHVTWMGNFWRHVLDETHRVSSNLRKCDSYACIRLQSPNNLFSHRVGQLIQPDYWNTLITVLGEKYNEGKIKGVVVWGGGWVYLYGDQGLLSSLNLTRDGWGAKYGETPVDMDALQKALRMGPTSNAAYWRMGWNEEVERRFNQLSAVGGDQ